MGLGIVLESSSGQGALSPLLVCAWCVRDSQSWKENQETHTWPQPGHPSLWGVSGGCGARLGPSCVAAGEGGLPCGRAAAGQAGTVLLRTLPASWLHRSSLADPSVSWVVQAFLPVPLSGTWTPRTPFLP